MKKMILLLLCAFTLSVYAQSSYLDVLTFTGIKIPYHETLTFNEANTQYIDGAKVFAFEFTVEKMQLLSFGSEGDAAIFALFDENGNGGSIGSKILAPSTYKLLVANVMDDRSEPLVCDVQISASDVQFTNMEFPFEQELTFSEAKTLNIDGARMFLYTFTLDKETVVKFSGSTYDHNFNLYDQSMYQIDGSSNMTTPLVAGTYYLLISDNGFYGGGEDLVSTITVSPLAVFEEIQQLPYQEALTFSPENYTYALQYTLSSSQLVTLSSNDDRISLILYSADMEYITEGSGFSENMPAGTFYVVIEPWGPVEDNPAVTVNISSATLQYTDITIPFEQTLVFDDANTELINGYKTFKYKFELPETAWLSFSYSVYGAHFTLYDENIRVIDSGSQFSDVYDSGTYYLFIDSQYYWEEGDLTSDIKIEKKNAIDYDKVDYANLLTAGVPVAKTTAAGEVVDTPDYMGVAAGYTFKAEKGKVYKISYTGYIDENYVGNVESSLTLLQGGVLTGNFYKDILNSERTSGIVNNEQSLSWSYYAKETANIRLLVQTNGILLFTLKVEELDTPVLTLTELLASTTAVITYSDELAYTDKGMLDQGKVPLVIGSEKFRNKDELYYAAAYKINLNADEQIKIHYAQTDDGYLYVYDADGKQLQSDDDGYNGDEYLEFTAESVGDYYIVGTTHSAERIGAYYITVWNTSEEPENSYDKDDADIITLAELLADTEKEITYSVDLSYQDAGVLGKSTSSLVAGGNGFRYEGGLYYAAAYKIHLDAAEQIKIHYDGDFDGYLYVFGADGSMCAYNDNGAWTIWLRGEYIDFTAPVAGDYYIVGTTNSHMRTGNYVLNVWNTTELPENPLITALQASETTVEVVRTASDADILLALSMLELTAVADNDNEVTIYNKILNWQLNAEQTEAEYVLTQTVIGYDVDQDVSVKVTISKTLDPIQPVITALSTTSSVNVPADATEAEIKAILANLIIRGTASDDETVTVPNSTAGWTIEADKRSAAFRPQSGVLGYTYAADLSVSVTINHTVGVDELAPNNITLYAQNGTIYISGCATGDALFVFSTSGRLIQNKTAATEIEMIRVDAGGVYIVLVNNKAYKVMVK